MAVHWCRHVMNEHTQSVVNALRPERISTLEISGSHWHDFGFRDYASVEYPGFDICESVLPDRYDLIVAEQVFEHISHPAKAAANVLQMLRNGGQFLVTTPFLIRYHPAPLDLWRWTAAGLKCFLEEAGFADVRTFSWGNKPCVVANLDSWVIYDPSAHSLENDPDYPIVVWGFGRRGA